MSAEIPQTESEFSPSALGDVLSSTAVPTLYREHEADLVVAQKETAAEGVVAWDWFFRGPRELRVRWST